MKPPRRTFTVPSLERYQHYRDRKPPWIKLHADVLEDYEFGALPDASKAHLMQIWIVASRMERVPWDPDWLGSRINATEPVDLDLLAAQGFIQPCSATMEQDASKMLAKCSTAMEQDASELLAECSSRAPARGRPRPGARPRARGETETEKEKETEKVKVKDVCTELAARDSAPAPFIELPLARKGESAAITDAHIAEWSDAYPGVDVRQQLRHMRQWLQHSPTRRKTANGIGRFITAWLSREQNRGPGSGTRVRASARETPTERMARLMEEDEI